jgi:hypothetical protein
MMRRFKNAPHQEKRGHHSHGSNLLPSVERSISVRNPALPEIYHGLMQNTASSCPNTTGATVAK